MNKRTAYLIILFGFTVAIGFILGCAATSVFVPVTRPAEVNLRGINRIVVGEITGKGGQSIADLLTSRLFESGKFEVLERAQLDRIMREHALNLTGAVDERTAAEVGKLIGATTLISGNVSNYKYDLKTTYSDWKTLEGKQFRTWTKTGTARVAATFKVIGLHTGKILAAKTISREAVRTASADDKLPPDPDSDAAMNEAVGAVVGVFIKMIAPYRDYVKIVFAPTDKNLPELEQGINFAKLGRWGDAVEQFKLAIQKNPTHDGAWYNLGLAYEYSYMFREAEEAFIEANKIKPCEKCLQEINNVRRLAAERKRLEEQGGL
jgi:tetratricopeptide (TPR) repeat protein